MAAATYVICMLTAFVCAALLFNNYRKTRIKLLLWGAICFSGLTINNGLVFVDLVIVPSVSLYAWRQLIGFGSMLVLIIGLVWEAR